MNFRDVLIRILMPLGICLVLAGEAFYWMDAIVYKGCRPLGLPLFGKVITPPPVFTPFSYGTLILILLVIVYFAARVRRPLVIGWCAFFLLLLGLNCPLQIGFSQPSWLALYWEYHVEQVTMVAFANQFSLPDLGPAPTSSTLTAIDGLYDRWETALLSLRIGWTFHVAGSLCLLAGTLLLVRSWRVIRPHVPLALLLIVLMLAVNLTRPLAGESCWVLGLQAERAGKLEQARSYYRWAQSLDVWNCLNARVYERLGAIDQSEGKTTTPEFHFFEALRDGQMGRRDTAFAEFSLAASNSRDPYLRREARLQFAALSASLALNLFSNGAPSFAANYWLMASRSEETHVAEDYMGARALQDSGQYSAAVATLTRAQQGATDVLITSQIDSSIGDVYYMNEDINNARLQFLNSENVISSYTEYKNLRATKSLTDNLQP